MSNTAEEDREAEIDYEEVEMNDPLPDEYYPENPDGNAEANGESAPREGPKTSTEEPDYPIFPNILFIYGHKYHSVSARQIREHFEPFGKVLDVSCRSNLAFVKFEKAEDAARAKSELHRKAGLGSPTIIVDYKKDIPPKSKQSNDKEREKYDRPARNRDAERTRENRDGGNQPRNDDNNRGRSSDRRNDRIDDRNNNRNERRYDDRPGPSKYDAPNGPTNYRRSLSRDRNYRPNDYPRANDRDGRNPVNDFNRNDRNDDNYRRDYRDNSRPRSANGPPPPSSMNDRYGPPTSSNNYPPRDHRDRDGPGRPASPRDYGRNGSGNGPSSSYDPRDGPPSSHGQGRGYDNYGPPPPASSRSPPPLPRSHSPPPPTRNYSPPPPQQHKRSYDTHSDNRSGSYGRGDGAGGRAPYEDPRDPPPRPAGRGPGGRGQDTEPSTYAAGANRYRSPDRFDNRDRDYDNRDRDYSRPSASMHQPRGADFEQGRGGGAGHRDNRGQGDFNQPPRDQYQPPREMNKRPRY